MAEIKKTARTFLHPTRQVKLYEDLDFDLGEDELFSDEEEQESTLQSAPPAEQPATRQAAAAAASAADGIEIL